MMKCESPCILWITNFFLFTVIEGYVKTRFEKVLDHRNKIFQHLCGSITDGTYKHEVRVRHSNKELNLEKGQKVEIKEIMNIGG